MNYVGFDDIDERICRQPFEVQSLCGAAVFLLIDSNLLTIRSLRWRIVGEYFFSGYVQEVTCLYAHPDSMHAYKFVCTCMSSLCTHINILVKT